MIDAMLIDAPAIEAERERTEKALRVVYGEVDRKYDQATERIEDTKKRELVRESLKTHYKEVTAFVIERAEESSLEPWQIRALVLAAAWHDAEKENLQMVPSEVPENMKQNFSLLSHGDYSSETFGEFFKSHPELLDYVYENIEESQKEQKTQEVVEVVSKIIKAHMGPNPGFMENLRVFARTQLKGVDGIDDVWLDEKLPSFTKPGDYEDQDLAKMANILLLCDMRSLVGVSGIQKVLNLRMTNQSFKDQDEDKADLWGSSQQYSNVKFDAADAALVSALSTVSNVISMFSSSQEDKEYILKAFKETLQKDFTYGDIRLLIDGAMRGIYFKLSGLDQFFTEEK